MCILQKVKKYLKIQFGKCGAAIIIKLLDMQAMHKHNSLL